MCGTLVHMFVTHVLAFNCQIHVHYNELTTVHQYVMFKSLNPIATFN